MAEPKGIGLADAIDALQQELALARSHAATHDVQFPIHSVTVQLEVAVTKSADGKAGFSVPVFGEIGVGGSYDNARTQTVTLVLDPPVDRSGQPIKVSEVTGTELAD